MKHFHKITCNSLSVKKPNGELAFVPVANDANYKITLSNAAAAQDSVISIPDPGASAANFVMTDQTNDRSLVTATASELNALNGATATAAEINYLDLVALGTGAASKAVVLDTGEDYVWPNAGVLTLGNVATIVESAEHGAGAIGTAVVPKTYRWIEQGVIVTQIKIDLTGLKSKNTANDVIGLGGGGNAYIGRNVVADNGIIFKAALACLETPAGGDDDVNVVINSSGTLAYDGAGGTTYVVNAGTDAVAGKVAEALAQGLTANHYIYLTAGTGDLDVVYTAGMFIITTWGHALLA